jgi:hypothetical protein
MGQPGERAPHRSQLSLGGGQLARRVVDPSLGRAGEGDAAADQDSDEGQHDDRRADGRGEPDPLEDAHRGAEQRVEDERDRDRDEEVARQVESGDRGDDRERRERRGARQLAKV